MTKSEAVKFIGDYIYQLDIPTILDTPNYFKQKSYAVWGAEELKKYVESMPDHYMDSIALFIDKMDDYSTFTGNSIMFSIAKDIAEDIFDELFKKEYFNEKKQTY